MAKPVLKPSWLTGYAGLNAVEPSGGKKAAGWVPDERPPAEYMNWLFQNLSDWVDYVDEISGQLEAVQQQYAAIVGTVGGASIATHNTLAAALADVAVPAGSRILILESKVMAAVAQITKNNIEIVFGSNVTLSKGAGTSCIQVSATGCRIIGGRVSGYSGGGDKAIVIDAGSKNTILRDIVFANCTLEVEDLAINTSQLGCLTEE
jgi:hypothetical protein